MSHHTQAVAARIEAQLRTALFHFRDLQRDYDAAQRGAWEARAIFSSPLHKHVLATEERLAEAYALLRDAEANVLTLFATVAKLAEGVPFSERMRLLECALPCEQVDNERAA